jgi:hypothetical protein
MWFIIRELFMTRLSVLALCSAALIGGPAMAQEKSQAAETFFKNKLTSQVQSSTVQALESLVDGLEITIGDIEDQDTSYSLLKVQPLVDDVENGTAIFLQVSANRTANRNTANIGLGYRKLVADGKIILGANGFYDSEWTYEHERASAGFEVLSSVGDFRYNQYFAITDGVTGAGGAEERALDGFDAEIAVPLPYLPQTKLHAKAFKFDSDDVATVVEGQTYSLRSALPYSFTIELGSTTFDDSRADQDYANLSYQVSFGSKPSNPTQFISNVAYQLSPVHERRFEKVRRANTIRKSGAFVVSVSGV